MAIKHPIRFPTIARIVEPCEYSLDEKCVGQVVQFGKKRFLIEEAPNAGSCKGCDLLIEGVCHKPRKCPCSAYSRMDKRWVIFKAFVKNK